VTRVDNSPDSSKSMADVTSTDFDKEDDKLRRQLSSASETQKKQRRKSIVSRQNTQSGEMSRTRSRSDIDAKALNMAAFKLRTTTMRESVLKVVHEEEKEADQNSCRPSYLDLTQVNSSSVSHKSFTPRDYETKKKSKELTYLGNMHEPRKKSSSVRGSRPTLNRDKASKKDKDNDSFATSEDTDTHDVWKGNKAFLSKKDRVDQ